MNRDACGGMFVLDEESPVQQTAQQPVTQSETQVRAAKKSGIRALWERIGDGVCEIGMGAAAVAISYAPMGKSLRSTSAEILPFLDPDTAGAILPGLGFLVVYFGIKRLVSECRQMRAERRNRIYGAGVCLNPQESAPK